MIYRYGGTYCSTLVNCRSALSECFQSQILLQKFTHNQFIDVFSCNIERTRIEGLSQSFFVRIFQLCKSASVNMLSRSIQNRFFYIFGVQAKLPDFLSADSIFFHQHCKWNISVTQWNFLWRKLCLRLNLCKMISYIIV